MKKQIIKIVFGFFAVSIVSCSANKLEKKGIYKEVEPSEYKELLKQDDINIIDVRTKSEFNKSHIKGAINASYFSGSFLKIVSSYNLDKEKLTLIYCETQHRSPLAARRLNKAGFNKLIDLKSGMSFWRKQGFSYESE